MRMLSVIVPVYNASAYIETCVASICNQTFCDLEIILVDDGSQDDSGKKCDEYAMKDKRIRVIHKSNGGSTSARKAGLNIAKGEFIGFIDADDWIETDFYQKMILLQEKTGADIVSSGHYHDIGNKGNKIFDNFEVGIYERDELLTKLMYDGKFFEYGVQPHLVTKIFRKNILLGVQQNIHDDIVIGEDAVVVYGSILEAERVYISDICCYHYVQHDGSMTKKEISKPFNFYQKQFTCLEELFKKKKVWKQLEIQLVQYEKYMIFMHNMALFKGEILSPYGGIPKWSEVVIYGAGVLGKKMYNYLQDKVDICLWVDRESEYYVSQGYSVDEPKQIIMLKEFDFVVIANTREQVANQIRKYLIELGIEEEKILWFSKEFINERKIEKMLNI